MISILGISGSLRALSSNTLLLKALPALMPPDATLSVFEGIGDLPHFNPDADLGEGFRAVQRWREAVAQADAVVISTPEYAFGVPGVLKNALDWLVSSGELNEKPVAAISASPLWSGGDQAMAALLPTLRALGTDHTGHSTCSIGSVNKKVTADATIQDPGTAAGLQELIEALCEKVRQKEVPGPAK